MSEATAPIDVADELLAEVAELDMALLRHVNAQALAATDPDTLNAYVRSAQRLARSVRQTLTTKARLKREGAEEARRAAILRPRPSAPGESYFGVLTDQVNLESAALARVRAEYDPSEVEAIEDEMADLIEDVWETARFPELSLADQVEGLMARIREVFGAKAASCADPAEGPAASTPPEPAPDAPLPPDPYVPPWERPQRGTGPPGGSGW